MKILVRSLLLLSAALFSACASTRVAKKAAPIRNEVELSNPVASNKLAVGQTILTYVCKPGDFVTEGKPRTFTEQSGAVFNLTVVRDREIHVDITHSGESWSLFVGPPAPIQVSTMTTNKTYAAMRMPSASNHGYGELDFFGHGRGNNQVNGMFKVLELSLRPDGSVERCAIDFFMHGDRPTTDGIMGALRYHSTVPVPIMSM